MANNIAVKDAAGATQTVKTTDNAGVHTPHHNVDSLPALPSGTNDIGKVRQSVPAVSAFTEAPINASSSGDNTLVSGTGGQTVRAYKLFLVVAGDVNIKFKSGAGTDLCPAMAMSAGGSMTLDFDGEPWFTTAVGDGLVLNLSAAVQVSGRLYYTKS